VAVADSSISMVTWFGRPNQADRATVEPMAVMDIRTQATLFNVLTLKTYEE